MIDFQPTDEQQLVIDTVRDFAANEIRPKARECDESKQLPEKVLAQAHELGLVANALPESAGGGGERSAVTGVLVAEELAVGDLSIALGILSPGLSAFPIAEFGTEEQKKGLARFAGPHFVAGSLAWEDPAPLPRGFMERPTRGTSLSGDSMPNRSSTRTAPVEVYGLGGCVTSRPARPPLDERPKLVGSDAGGRPDLHGPQVA